MKKAKWVISSLCMILAVLLLAPALSGCAQLAGATDGEPKAAATGAAETPRETVTEEEKTDPATEPERTEAAEPYDTYEAYMKFINGLTDQDKIDLVQSTADSITVIQDHLDPRYPSVDENPDALAKIEALGKDILPYLIRYAYYENANRTENQKKSVLLMYCAVWYTYKDVRDKYSTMLPEYPEEFNKYFTPGTPGYYAVRFYLWYCETRSE